MALDIYNRYGPRANPADANYPYGSIKNESIPTADDGTPLEKDWGNDLAGFQQRLLVEGGVAPSGNSDTILNSDYYDALQNVLKRNGGKPFTTVAALKADNTVKIGDFVTIESYTSTNNSGAMFGRIVASATGVDDGGEFIDLPGSGLQFKQNLPTLVSVKLFGAEGDGVTDDYTASQSAANFAVSSGVNLYFPGSKYKLGTTLTIDLSSIITDEESRPSIFGDGKGATTLLYEGSSAAINLIGGASGAGVHSYVNIEGLRIDGASPVDPASRAFQLDNLAYFVMRDVTITLFGRGIQTTDILSSMFEKVNIRFCNEGMSFAYSNFSRPNAISLVDCVLGNLATFGVDVQEGAVFNMRGGSVEGVGSSPANYGIRFVDSGTEGALGCNLDGVYFEHNVGAADVVIESINKFQSNIIKGCSFARISNTNYTEKNIVFSAVDSVLSIVGCGFKELGTYVVDPSRPYINSAGSSGNYNITEYGNYYSDASSRPLDGPLSADDCVAQVRARIDAAGGIVNSKNVASVVKNATGDYTVNYFRQLRTLSNQIVATCYSLPGSGGLTINEVGQTANSCQLQIFDQAGVLIDPVAINLTVFGDIHQGW